MANLTAVFLENVETIGNKAFNSCVKLTTINLDKVTFIGASAFENCISLTTINVTDCEIGPNAFSSCASLARITIDQKTNQTKNIGENAFSNCQNLDYLYINFRSNLSSCFTNCTSIKTVYFGRYFTQTIEYGLDFLPASVQSITFSSRNPLYANYNSDGVVYSKSLKTLILYPSSANFSNYTVPSSVTVIGPSAFKRSHTSRIFFENPSNITVEKEAFAYSRISQININFTEVKDYAFVNCTNLIYIGVVPNWQGILGRFVFSGCGSETRPPTIKNWGYQTFPRGTFMNSNVAKLNASEFDTSFDFNHSFVFYGCTRLIEVILNPSLTAITFGTSYFGKCTSLSSFILSTNKNNFDLNLGDFCFARSNFTQLLIPDNLFNSRTIIGNYCFTETPVEKWTFKKYGSSGKGIFSNCSSLTTVTIQSNVIEIPDFAFYCASNLISLTFMSRSSLTTIGNRSFYNTSINSSKLTLPTACTIIKEYSFANTPILSLAIAKNVTEIGKGAFQGCTNLLNVTIEGTISEIPDNCFYLNRALVSFEYKAGNKPNIGAYAFRFCTSLVSFDFDKFGAFGDYSLANTGIDQITLNDPHVLGFAAFLNTNVTNISNCIAGENSGFTFNSIKGTLMTSDGKRIIQVFKDPNYLVFQIPRTVETIDKYAFRESIATNISFRSRSGLTEGNAFRASSELLEVTNYPCEIMSYAFYLCRKLIRVTLASNQTRVGENAFLNCSSLTEFNFGQIQSIGEFSFRSTAIKEVKLAESYTGKIADSAFFGLSTLISIDLGFATEVGDSSFYGNMAETIVGLKVTTIRKDAFGATSSLKSINFPLLSIIEDNAFIDTALKTFKYQNDDLRTTGCHIFESSAIEQIDLNQITKIEPRAFENLRFLTTIKMEFVEEIGEYAFNRCLNLVTLDSPNNIRIVSDYAFYQTPKLSDLNLPELTKIGRNAFDRAGMTTFVAPLLEEIQDYAFKNSRLTNIDLMKGKNIKTVGETIFVGANITGKVTIPKILIPQDQDKLLNGCIAQQFYQCRGITEFTIEGQRSNRTGLYAKSGIIYYREFVNSTMTVNEIHAVPNAINLDFNNYTIESDVTFLQSYSFASFNIPQLNVNPNWEGWEIDTQAFIDTLPRNRSVNVFVGPRYQVINFGRTESYTRNVKIYLPGESPNPPPSTSITEVPTTTTEIPTSSQTRTPRTTTESKTDTNTDNSETHSSDIKSEVPTNEKPHATSKSGSSSGIIAGSVIGVVVIAAIIVLVVIVVIKKKKEDYGEASKVTLL